MPLSSAPASEPTIPAIGSGEARWLAPGEFASPPMNRFFYFKREFRMEELPGAARLFFAADPTAACWLNGRPLRRKVARFMHLAPTAEWIDVGPLLKPGDNCLLVRLHSWGDMITFMRSALTRAAIWVDSDFGLLSDEHWQYVPAPQFTRHETRFAGIHANVARIRFPVEIDGGKLDEAALVARGDGHALPWRPVTVLPEIEGGQAPPQPVETPGQREYLEPPIRVLAAGRLDSKEPFDTLAPHEVAGRIVRAHHEPDAEWTRAAASVLTGCSWTRSLAAGDSIYVTFDFERPVHGYPCLDLEDAAGGAIVDFGYGEIHRALYDGRIHVRPDGWINTEGIVGQGYADRYRSRTGRQQVELPDERTARWLGLHLHATRDTTLSLHGVGIVTSQYAAEPVGTFHGGHEVIARLVRLCDVHARVTMTDALVDTPGREDGQWVEDDRPRAQIADRWYGDGRLRQLLLRTFAQCQFPNGNFHPFAPSNFPIEASIDWAIQWVACLWDEYWWSGDTAVLSRYWPNLTRFWQFILGLLDENGLMISSFVLADLRNGVQLDADHQSSGVVTSGVIERLAMSIRMARALGETQTAQAWEAALEKMSRAFRRYHVLPAEDGRPLSIGDRYDPVQPEAERGVSQAATVNAILANLLSDEEARALLDYVAPDPEGAPPEGVFRWNTPTYCYRMLKCMSRFGHGARAMRHLIERYGPYLPGHPANSTPPELQGALGGPLPEYWLALHEVTVDENGTNPTQPNDETGSHGWGAVPMLWLHECVLGINWNQPGGGELVIAPDAAGLPYVAGHSNTPLGLAYVRWEPARFELRLSLPGPARIHSPAECPGRPLRVAEGPEPGTTTARGELTLSQQGEYRMIVD